MSTAASATAAMTDGDPSTTGNDADPTAAETTSTSGTGLASSSTAGDEGSGESSGCEPSGRGVVDFSYIWIANSTQGTVSKIDTQSAREVGRYLVDDYEGVSISSCQGPSRTSVNLDGDVAVLDRGGGLAKFYANEADCADLDGDMLPDTSTDETYLPWGEDGCLAWKIDVPHSGGNCDGPRAVQWTAPDQLDACTFGESKAWVAFCNENSDNATVWLVNGADGTVERSIPVFGYGCDTYGPYGGVVDAENNFWFVDRGADQTLYKVRYDCPLALACVDRFAQPAGEDAYGITIGGDGRIWIAGSSNSLYAFDPSTETYASLQPDLDAFFGAGPTDSNPNNTLRGLMADEDGVLWVAAIANGAWGGGANPGLLRVDPGADPVEIDFYGPDTLGGIVHAAGISIDVDGYIWLVDTLGDQAFKIDPLDPATHEVVTGLQYPYTYSDMTGFALKQILPG